MLVVSGVFKMTVKVGEEKFRLDWLKWLFILLFVIVAVIGNSYYGSQPILYRVLALVGIGILTLWLSVNTAKGNAVWVIIKESQVEVRKVVWPTRQETNQMTLIVVILVLVMAIILWGLDSLLGWLASLIIG
jgi:preprotein translocase subunit SecE